MHAITSKEKPTSQSTSTPPPLTARTKEPSQDSSAKAITKRICGANPGTANTILRTLNAATTGFISGAISDIVVNETTTQKYKVSMKVGDQTFEGVTTPTNNGVFILISTADPANRVTFNYAASVAGITSVGTFKWALNATFKNAQIM